MAEVTIKEEQVVTKKVVLEMTMNEAMAVKHVLGNILGDRRTSVLTYVDPIYWKLNTSGVPSLPLRFIKANMEVYEVPGIDNLSETYK
jgi:hypothetical protein